MHDFYADPDARSHFVPLLAGLAVGLSAGVAVGLFVGVKLALGAM